MHCNIVLATVIFWTQNILLEFLIIGNFEIAKKCMCPEISETSRIADQLIVIDALIAEFRVSGYGRADYCW